MASFLGDGFVEVQQQTAHAGVGGEFNRVQRGIAFRFAHAHEFLRSFRVGGKAGTQTLERSAKAEVLTENDLLAWMGSMNAIRLVLGTQLDVTEDMIAIDPDDPRAPVFGVYGWLGMLVERGIEALQGSIADLDG